MKLASYLNGIACAAFVLILASCGVPGIPQPPSLDLPRPVSDLQAVRKGNRVFLAWTVPSQTTDGTRLKHPGATQICRSAETPTSCANVVETVRPSAIPKSTGAQENAKASATDQLGASLVHEDPAAQLFYAVSVLNERGRSAGLSNVVAVAAVPSLPPPPDFRAEVRADGVLLSWTGESNTSETPGLRHVYRVYRRMEGSNAESMVGEMPAGNQRTYLLIDRSFEWEKTYVYRATVVDVINGDSRPEAQFEGDDTPAVRVFVHDVFPPAVPSGLQAVFSGVGQKPFIDLIWAPDTDTDLAGYNVYRHESDSAPEKINSELVKGPAFRDANVTAGHSYVYAVSAVDVRGNESARSGEATESVP